jgi:hypothetical protein
MGIKNKWGWQPAHAKPNLVKCYIFPIMGNGKDVTYAQRGGFFMLVDYNLEGNPYCNLWAAVVSTALLDLKIKFNPSPRGSGAIVRQLDRRQAIWFFSCPDESLLSWICFHLQIDLQATIKRAAEINPAVKKALSNDKIECYHKGTI